jgi:hypothetical protein
MKLLVAGLAAALCTASATNATVWVLHAHLDGLQEVPPVATPGVGFVELTLDDLTGQVTLISGSFSGLLSPATVAHIHGLAPVGVNAGVLIPLDVTTATSGTLGGSGTLTAPNIAGMLDGLTYINVHTGLFPGGEIRGQLIVIPAPGALAMIGAVGLLAMRRRR